jgi:hypothetical protein
MTDCSEKHAPPAGGERPKYYFDLMAAAIIIYLKYFSINFYMAPIFAPLNSVQLHF